MLAKLPLMVVIVPPLRLAEKLPDSLLLVMAVMLKEPEVALWVMELVTKVNALPEDPESV